MFQVPEAIEESTQDDSSELFSMSSELFSMSKPRFSGLGWSVAKRSGSLTSGPSSCDKFSVSMNKSIRMLKNSAMKVFIQCT